MIAFVLCLGFVAVAFGPASIGPKVRPVAAQRGGGGGSGAGGRGGGSPRAWRRLLPRHLGPLLVARTWYVTQVAKYVPAGSPKLPDRSWPSVSASPAQSHAGLRRARRGLHPRRALDRVRGGRLRARLGPVAPCADRCRVRRGRSDAGARHGVGAGDRATGDFRPSAAGGAASSRRSHSRRGAPAGVPWPGWASCSPSS